MNVYSCELQGCAGLIGSQVKFDSILTQMSRIRVELTIKYQKESEFSHPKIV